MTSPSDGASADRQMSADADVQQEHPRKRRRIPVACNACRTRKSRCDGVRPQCSACVTLHIDCIYSANPLASASAVSSSIHALEARLSAVEDELRSIAGARQVGSSVAALPLLVEIGDGHNASSHLDPGGETSIDESPGVTDGVGTVEFAAEQGSAFFGPSSNISFTRLIRRATFHTYHALEHPLASNQRGGVSLASQSRDQLLISRPQSPDHPSPPKSWPSAVAPKGVRLPPVSDVTKLVTRFFSDTGMLFPYIHERTFWETFDQVKQDNFRRARPSWLGLLNMILAMATSTSLVDNATVDSDSFFANAESLSLKPMTTGATTVEIVQVMLLMVQYLQGTQRSVQTWAVHGRVMSTAIQMGLHANDALENLAPLECEIRVRTWYSCVVIDRMMSLTFGRPPAIPDCYIRVDLPKHLITSPSSDSPAMQWSADENSTLFWNATITLYKIMNKVIELLYGYNLGSGSLPSVAEMASSSLSIEQQLKSWTAALPDSMALIRGSDLDPTNRGSLAIKFRLVLTLRYHNTRILAHRPILDRHLQLLGGHTMDRDESAVIRHVGGWSKDVCLQSAQSIIELIDSVLITPGRQRECLGAWWFTLYYTFNAALVVAATLLCSNTGTALSQQSNQEKALLDRAIACLPLLESSGRMPEKCARFIAVLRQHIDLLDRFNREPSMPVNSNEKSMAGDSGLGSSGNYTGNAGNGVDWMTMDPALFPTLDMNWADAGMQEFSHFVAPEHMDEIGQGDLLW